MTAEEVKREKDIEMANTQISTATTATKIHLIATGSERKTLCGRLRARTAIVATVSWADRVRRAWAERGEDRGHSAFWHHHLRGIAICQSCERVSNTGRNRLLRGRTA
jgi:hypothetical protein